MTWIDRSTHPLPRRGRFALGRFFLALALLLFGILLPAAGMGREEARGAPPPSARDAALAAPQPGSGPAHGAGELPLTRVVLFTSGLGYFEREARISGNKTLGLELPTAGINDLLASLIVRDSGGGRVTSIDYPSRDPLARSLGSLALDLTDNPTLAALLLQARGKEIRLAAPEPITGRILSVETRQIPETSARASGQTSTREAVFINLLTPAGIRSINLERVSSILFLDPRLQADLAKALSLLSGARGAERKRVDIAFVGSGTREVSVGYLAETPVWKASYRLAIGEGGKASLLQGWAIVENTSGEDWRGVRLDLVSGQPLSFVMDLYRPVYTRRPEVSVPLPPSILPQLYGEAMTGGQPGASSEGGAPEERLRKESPASRASSAPAAPPAAIAPGEGLLARDKGLSAAELLAPGGGVSAMAVGSSLGELFRYAMVDPVSIAQNQSALLPIVSQTIQGERLSIYNERVLEKHPLAGFRLRNTTGLQLMSGPVSVFEGGAYAGEAELGDIGPGRERIISYAVDLDIEVSAQGASLPDSITEVRITRGALIVSRTLRRERDYTSVNRGLALKRLLIEYPLSGDWRLVEPAKPAEQTRDRYRFSLELPARGPAGAPAGAAPAEGPSLESGASAGAGSGATGGGGATHPVVLRVIEERSESQSVALTTINSDTIGVYLKQQTVSPAVRAALAKLVRLRSELAELARERQGVESRIAGIRSDQERIRGNMAELDRGSTLYKRYVATLDSQEDALGNLASRLDSLQGGERSKQKEIDDFIASLDLS